MKDESQFGVERGESVAKRNGRTDGNRTVYAIDDDIALLVTLQCLLEDAQIGVLPYSSGEQFLRELDDLEPCPIPLDVRMPGISGFEVLREVVGQKVQWPVVVLSGFGDIAIAVEALKLGAIDFLEKPVKTPDLLQSIDVAFEQLAVGRNVESCRDQAKERMALLTPREAQVIELLIQGRSNKQVAFDLGISVRTVEMHRAKGQRRLNVRSIVEAAALRHSTGARRYPPSGDAE